LSSNRAPPPPRRRESLTRRLCPAPLWPDRRRDRQEARRVGGTGGWAGGRGRGPGAEGRPLLRLQLPALWLRLALTLALFPEPRDVTGKQPIVVGPRRPPRAGHPAATHGGHHLGRRRPQRLELISGAGQQLPVPALGHRPQSPVAISWGRCPPGEGVGGIRVVMGTRRPLAGWGESGRRGLATLPASFLTTHSGPRSVFAPLRGSPRPPHRPACGLTAVASVWPPQKVKGGGWIRPPRFRRGRSLGVSSLRVAC
jgi:hypothetical protein